MKTKIIYGIEYKIIDWKEGEDIIMPDANIYLEGEQVITGNIDCKNIYVRGDQDVEGNQYVRGSQDVRGIAISSYCKWRIVACKNTIKIGCEEKTTKEWEVFFNECKTYETPTDSKEYQKIKSAFQMAVVAQSHLLLMNKSN